MTIKDADGAILDGVLVARDDVTLRVLVPGEDDVRTFYATSGGWFDHDGRPVTITFAWEGRAARSVPDESDCICPPDFAARLISILCGRLHHETEGMFYEFAPNGRGVRVRTSGRSRNRICPEGDPTI